MEILASGQTDELIILTISIEKSSVNEKLGIADPRDVRVENFSDQQLIDIVKG